MSHTNQTHAQRIMAILDPSGEPMYIGDLREKIIAQLDKPNRQQTIAANSGVSSALVNMRDRGELRITGGGHNNSRKMIAIIPLREAPKGRMIRLTDVRHNLSGLTAYGGNGLQSCHVNLVMMCGE
jgi:hypothetical protein